jgi:hypothetical protein
MTDDALGIFNAMRPPSPQAGEGIRAPASSRSRELHDLAMVPGSPGYTARIPRPPCHACGEDHFPGREYDHPWTPEPVAIHDEPVSASSIVRRPQIVDAEAQPVPFRVALYVGRGDTYVVAVEYPPEWDTRTAFRVPSDQVMPLIEMARALEVKITDKTGGDLFMLESEYAREHEKDNGRGAASPGGGGARRPRPAARGPQEGEPDDTA